ncbi:hypothetical protein O6241_23830, partial [Salmonella enterica subsp. enterica]
MAFSHTAYWLAEMQRCG